MSSVLRLPTTQGGFVDLPSACADDLGWKCDHLVEVVRCEGGGGGERLRPECEHVLLRGSLLQVVGCFEVYSCGGLFVAYKKGGSGGGRVEDDDEACEFVVTRKAKRE